MGAIFHRRPQMRGLAYTVRQLAILNDDIIDQLGQKNESWSTTAHGITMTYEVDCDTPQGHYDGDPSAPTDIPYSIHFFHKSQLSANPKYMFHDICRYFYGALGIYEKKRSGLMKGNVKLYNMIFPIWMLLILPVSWLVALPANFVIDLAVIVLTLKYLKAENMKEAAKKSIFKVWMIGFVSDFIGGLFMFLATTNEWLRQRFEGVAYNPFEDIPSFLWTVMCMAIASVCIYFFNYKISFKATSLDDAQKRKLSLSLAICTSPYLFLLPTNWFY